MKRKAKAYRKKVVTANNKPKRNKKSGASMVKRRGHMAARTEEVVKVDLVHKEEQRTALYTELALQPPASIGKRLKCRMGIHGDTTRAVITMWVDTKGNRKQKHSYIEEYFCVSCAAEWTENATEKRRRAYTKAGERTKQGPSSW